jgi:opacity protein-like surface antigen
MADSNHGWLGTLLLTVVLCPTSAFTQTVFEETADVQPIQNMQRGVPVGDGTGGEANDGRLSLSRPPPTLLHQAGTPAPDTHRIELFAGYSYLPELDSLVKDFNDSGHGGALSFSVNLTKHVGLLADFDAHSWTTHARTICPPSGMGCVDSTDTRTTVYSISVGPRFVVPVGRGSVFGLVGGEYQRNRYSESFLVGPGQLTNHSKAFGLAVGGGADYTVTRHLAVRVIQIDYSMLSFGEGPGRNLRLKSGLVLKF